MNINKQALEDTSLETLGTAMLTIGLTIISGAAGDVTKMGIGAALCVCGIAAYLIKYLNRGTAQYLKK